MIYVIDDQPIYRALFGAGLELGGYRVRTAEFGSQAIAQILDDPPELIVLDYTMIDMEVEDFLRWFRAEFHPNPIPVVATLTVLSEAALRVMTRFRVGHYLIKADYAPDELRRLVSLALGDDVIDAHIEEITRRRVLVEPVIERLQREANAELQAEYREKFLARP
ncbi:MAG: response regulator [Planctomycetota bacterium]